MVYKDISHLPSIFAFGDPHLPERVQIHKFQYEIGYFQKLIDHLSRFHPEVLLIAGDLVWHASMNQARDELSRLMVLSGKRKYFIEGNHDPWFDNLSTNLEACQNRAYELFSGDDFFYIGGRADIFTLQDGTTVGICGARGALLNEKVYTQEEYVEYFIQKESLQRALDSLEDLLSDTPTDYNICLLHYPPTHQVFPGGREEHYDLIRLIRESNFINKVIFSHVHVVEGMKLYQKLYKMMIYFVSLERLDFGAVRIL
ncbi:MAG: metallophosphoesterase [Promethearchaeota archaeon]